MNKSSANKQKTNRKRGWSPEWVSGFQPFSEGGVKGRSYNGNTGKNKPNKRVVCKNGIYKKPVYGNKCIDSALNDEIIKNQTADF